MDPASGQCRLVVASAEAGAALIPVTFALRPEDGTPAPPGVRGQAEVTSRVLQSLRRASYLYIAETPPFGVGVRTARPLQAGAVVIADEDGTMWGRTLTLAAALAQGWDQDRDLFQLGPDRYLPPRGCFDDLFNHSCEPSGGWRVTALGARFVTLRDLGAGEEITYDYSCHLLNPDEKMACACGASACRGTIGPFWSLPPSLQARYRGLDVVSPAVARAG